ncbi:MAG: HupE/UreJ family protein [Pirellulaceae bacterium]
MLLWVIAMVAPGVHAHEMRPGYLEITETEPGTFDVLWKVPARGSNERLSLNVRFADDVRINGAPISLFVADAHVQQMQIKHDGGLTGTTILIEGLDNTYTDVLLRLQRLDGSEITQRLTADRPSYVVQANPGPWQVAWTYFVLGVEHILLGIDHLLFVLALLLIVNDWWKLVKTITAFTIAHSITLVLATLGYVNVPGPPVEAIIALSIVFVAAEIVRGQHGKPGLTERWPWVVAFTFGLLHGLGFAGALSEVGLPQTSIPMALLTFNLGVEAGQLLFVAAMLAMYLGARWVLSQFQTEFPTWIVNVPAYAIGGIAAFWMVERVAGFWPAT